MKWFRNAKFAWSSSLPLMVNIFDKFESIIIRSKYRKNIFNLRKIILGRILKDRESIFKKGVVGMNKVQQTHYVWYWPKTSFCLITHVQHHTTTWGLHNCITDGLSILIWKNGYVQRYATLCFCSFLYLPSPLHQRPSPLCFGIFR